jgi:hypothetical protein
MFFTNYVCRFFMTTVVWKNTPKTSHAGVKKKCHDS